MNSGCQAQITCAERNQDLGPQRMILTFPIHTWAPLQQSHYLGFKNEMISGSSRIMMLSKIWRQAIKWCNFRFAIDSGRWETFYLTAMRDTWCPFSVTISVCPLQISTSIQNYFCDYVFWRHLWCFNRVRGPLVTAPDLLLYVQYVLCPFTVLHAINSSEKGFFWVCY